MAVRRRTGYLAALLALALLLRLVGYYRNTGIIAADEIFQYVEQAHRLVFGYGIVPWEYTEKIRSWLFPGVLAGVMELARVCGDGPVCQTWAVAIFLSLLSLLPVWCAFQWGCRDTGLSGGLIAGGLNAVWTECVLFSVHPLMDTVGADCLVAGAYLASVAAERGGRRRFAAAGAVLGLVVALRPHLLPAVLLAGLVQGRGSFRERAAPLLAGAAATLLLAGALDWVTLGTPFQSIWKYGWIVLVEHRAAEMGGVTPWYEYLLWLDADWQFALPIIAGAALVGGTRRPLLLGIALAVIAPFSLIGHKEPRYIYPAVPFLLTAAGIGCAVAASRASRMLGVRVREDVIGAAGIAAWVAISFAVTRTGNLQYTWQSGTGIVAEMHEVSADPASCRLAATPWGVGTSGGSAHLRLDIVFRAFDPDAPTDKAGPLDYVIAEQGIDLTRFGLTRLECRRNEFGPIMPIACLWHRPGGCKGR